MTDKASTVPLQSEFIATDEAVIKEAYLHRMNQYLSALRSQRRGMRMLVMMLLAGAVIALCVWAADGTRILNGEPMNMYMQFVIGSLLLGTAWNHKGIPFQHYDLVHTGMWVTYRKAMQYLGLMVFAVHPDAPIIILPIIVLCALLIIYLPDVIRRRFKRWPNGVLIRSWRFLRHPRRRRWPVQVFPQVEGQLFYLCAWISGILLVISLLQQPDLTLIRLIQSLASALVMPVIMIALAMVILSWLSYGLVKDLRAMIQRLENDQITLEEVRDELGEWVGGLSVEDYLDQHMPIITDDALDAEQFRSARMQWRQFIEDGDAMDVMLEDAQEIMDKQVRHMQHMHKRDSKGLDDLILAYQQIPGMTEDQLRRRMEPLIHRLQQANSCLRLWQCDRSWAKRRKRV